MDNRSSVPKTVIDGTANCDHLLSASGYFFRPAGQGRTTGPMFIAFRALQALIAS
jgi:hypothetical protein